MPVGKLKNALYGLALPVLGRRRAWRAPRDGGEAGAVARALARGHAVGACVQLFERGVPGACVAVGQAGADGRPVQPDTVFRTASIAKMACAMLVLRLQKLGRLHVDEDISDLLGCRVRSPHFPDASITLGMLLSHTSGIADSPAYFAAFDGGAPLSGLLGSPETYTLDRPGARFRYSNLAAGMVACLLEKRTGLSFEQLAQQELFAPLGIRATFDPSALDPARVADGYRVLPPALAFDARRRLAAAQPMDAPDPEHHYLTASGGLFITAPELARLALAAWSGADGFLDAQLMRRPVAGWPQREVNMRHGMGLLCIEDRRVCPRPLWGHQGFAYGAVNGVFFDEAGSGFASLNSGASERRVGHLALINRDLIRACLAEGEGGRA